MQYSLDIQFNILSKHIWKKMKNTVQYKTIWIASNSWKSSRVVPKMHKHSEIQSFLDVELNTLGGN